VESSGREPSPLFLLQAETTVAGRSKTNCCSKLVTAANSESYAGLPFIRRTDKLGDDIGRNLILDKGDAVAQLQFAFLQTLQPQEVRRRRLMQGIYRRVEIAVLLLQPCKLGFEFALILVGHDVC
jgi:hypothetical protein